MVTIFVVVMETRGGDERYVSGRAKINIMINHKDWVYGGMGARE